MELSIRVVQVRSTLKPEEEEFPSFSPDDIILLFGDVAKPVGLVLNHNNHRKSFVIFPSSEFVPDILKLADTPKWVDTHINLTVDRPRLEIIPIIAKLLEDKALEEGEEYEIILIEKFEAKGSAHFSTPKKGGNLLPLCWQSKLSPFKLMSSNKSYQPFLRRWMLDRCPIEVPLNLRMPHWLRPMRYHPFYTF